MRIWCSAAALLAALLLGGVVCAQDSVPDWIEQLETRGEDIEPAVIQKLGASGDRAAMEALVAAFPKLQSIYTKREVIRALAKFAGIENAEQPAMEALANIATSSRVRDLRIAAVEALGQTKSKVARGFLKLIVDSDADDNVRELALRTHIRGASADDADWYRHIWNPEEDRRKDAEGNIEALELASIREIALEGLKKFVQEEELVETVRRTDIHPRVRRSALEALHGIRSAHTAEMAEWLFERVDMPGPDRAAAAEILAELKGPAVLPAFLEIAKKGVVTPEDLRETMARLLSDMQNPQVDKELMRLVGRGSPEQKVFALMATDRLEDPKFLAQVRKGLEDRDPSVRKAAAEALAARKDKEALPALRKMLKRPRTPEDLRVALETITTIAGTDREWQKELMAFTSHEDRDVRNAAIDALAKQQVGQAVEVFLERLAHEDWTTRLAAIRALEGARTKDAVPALIDRLEVEKGRMARIVVDALWNLTAQPHGDNVAAWRAWWEREGENFAVVAPGELQAAAEAREMRRLKARTTTEAQFFGIRIISHRVIFVIDTSGSMTEPVRGRTIDGREATRIDVAKQELSQAIEKLAPGAFFNVLAFSSGIGRWLKSGIAESSEKNREAALEFVDRLGAGGATNIYDTLVEAFADPDVDTIYFLSDGEPTAGEVLDPHAIREEVAFWNKHRHVTIHTVAIGGNLEILRWLAEDSGGEHVKIR